MTGQVSNGPRISGSAELQTNHYDIYLDGGNLPRIISNFSYVVQVDWLNHVFEVVYVVYIYVTYYVVEIDQ
jgi:hypothetical protein